MAQRYVPMAGLAGAGPGGAAAGMPHIPQMEQPTHASILLYRNGKFLFTRNRKQQQQEQLQQNGNHANQQQQQQQNRNNKTSWGLLMAEKRKKEGVLECASRITYSRTHIHLDSLFLVPSFQYTLKQQDEHSPNSVKIIACYLAILNDHVPVPERAFVASTSDELSDNELQFFTKEHRQSIEYLEEDVRHMLNFATEVIQAYSHEIYWAPMHQQNPAHPVNHMAHPYGMPHNMFTMMHTAPQHNLHSHLSPPQSPQSPGHHMFPHMSHPSAGIYGSHPIQHIPGNHHFIHDAPSVPIQSKTQAVPAQKTVLRLHKTRLCENFQTLGFCPYAKKCAFAHGADDLKTRPIVSNHTPYKKQSLYKTTLCESFNATGVCAYLDKCDFAHGPNDLRRPDSPHSQQDLEPFPQLPEEDADIFHPNYFKTKLCRVFYLKGHCQYNENCLFAHGEHELRERLQIPQEDVTWITNGTTQIPETFLNSVREAEQMEKLFMARSTQVTPPVTEYETSPRMKHSSQTTPKSSISGSMIYALLSNQPALADTQEVLYKTKLCRHFKKRGMCPVGSECRFAHGLLELRRRPELHHDAKENHTEHTEQIQIASGQDSPEESDLYKTKLCRQFDKDGECPSGSSCSFAHGKEQLRTNAHASAEFEEVPGKSNSPEIAAEVMEDLLKHLWIDERNRAKVPESSPEVPINDQRTEPIPAGTTDSSSSAESPSKLGSTLYNLPHPPVVGSASNDNDHRVWGAGAFQAGLPRSLFPPE